MIQHNNNVNKMRLHSLFSLSPSLSLSLSFSLFFFLSLSLSQIFPLSPPCHTLVGEKCWCQERGRKRREREKEEEEESKDREREREGRRRRTFSSSLRNTRNTLLIAFLLPLFLSLLITLPFHRFSVPSFLFFFLSLSFRFLLSLSLSLVSSFIHLIQSIQMLYC